MHLQYTNLQRLRTWPCLIHAHRQQEWKQTDSNQVSDQQIPSWEPDQPKARGIDESHEDPSLRYNWDRFHQAGEYAGLILSRADHHLTERSRTMFRTNKHEGTRPEAGESTLHGDASCRSSPDCTRGRGWCRYWSRWACSQQDGQTRPRESEDAGEEAQTLRRSRMAL